MGLLSGIKKIAKNSLGMGLLGDALNPGSSGPSGQAQVLAELQAAQEAARLQKLQSQATVRQQLPVIAKSFDATRQNLATAAERTKRRLISPAGNPALYRASALGPGTSSLQPLVDRDVRAQHARAMQEIDTLLGQQLSPLASQESTAVGGVLGQDAGIGLSGVGLENNARFQLAQAYARPRRRKKGVLDLIGAAAPIIGTLAGGPAGGAAGSFFASAGAGALGQQGIDDYMSNGSGYGSY